MVTRSADRRWLAWLGLGLAVACGTLDEHAGPADASFDVSGDVNSGTGGQGAARPDASLDTSTGGSAGDVLGRAGAGGGAGSEPEPIDDDSGSAGAAGNDAVDSGSVGGEAGRCASDAGDCIPRRCGTILYDCGDCLDNDDDGVVDLEDPECTSPCQDTEQHTYIHRAGVDCTACKSDCFFDQDCGSGDDACFANLACDSLTPDSACPYDATAATPGTPRSCAELAASQSARCHEFCGPLVPNGCDCFGCCEVPGAPTPIWLGSRDQADEGTCAMTSLDDAQKCRPCTISQGCFNPCERCEVCVGKPDVASDCGAEQLCPETQRPCGRGCQLPCPTGEYCRSGCCTKAAE